MGFLWSIDNSEEYNYWCRGQSSLFFRCIWCFFFVSHSSLFYRFADVNRQIPVYFRLISTFVCLFHRKDLNEYRSVLCPKPKQSLLQPHVHIHTHKTHQIKQKRRKISEIPFFRQFCSFLFLLLYKGPKEILNLNQLKAYNVFEAKQVNIIENCFPFHNHPHIWKMKEWMKDSWRCSAIFDESFK